MCVCVELDFGAAWLRLFVSAACCFVYRKYEQRAVNKYLAYTSHDGDKLQPSRNFAIGIIDLHFKNSLKKTCLRRPFKKVHNKKTAHKKY